MGKCVDAVASLSGLKSWVDTLSRLFNISEPQFPHLQNGNNKSTHLTRENLMSFVQYMEQNLVHSKC